MEGADHVATYWHKIRMMFDNEVTCIGSNNCRSYNNQVFSNTSRIHMSQVNNLKIQKGQNWKVKKEKNDLKELPAKKYLDTRCIKIILGEKKFLCINNYWIDK